VTGGIPELPGQLCLEDVLDGAVVARIAPAIDPSGLRFEVPGTPVPQGSKKAFRHRHTGRVVMVDDNEHLEAWRANVAAVASRTWAGRPALTGPVVAHLDFFMPRPAGHYGTGRNAGVLKPSAPLLPAVKPDLDKLVRAVFDSLSTAGVWKDDALCWGVSAYKRYADGRSPGLVLELTPDQVEAEPDPAPVLVIRGTMAESAFDYFWALYPRKVGKPKARAAWDKAVKRADPSHIAAAASRYAADPNRSEQFTLHPTTWLNRDGWNDDPLPGPDAPTDRQGLILAREMQRARELDALEGNV